MKQRVCNIDWLEVYCLEPPSKPCPADFYKSLGYSVDARAYGTKIYHEVFTLMAHGIPFLEVRRNPLSKKSAGGIMPDNMCHIRLTNNTCYVNPIAQLRAFITQTGLLYKSIKRIDLAYDFNCFDNGWTPPSFIDKFLSETISKIYQSNIAAHGKDNWDGRSWNSLKWGSESSPVSTKLYNKTLEMKQVKFKPYIYQCWQQSDLDLTKDIWRIEFSIKSETNNFVNRQTGEIVPNSLLMYDTPHKLWVVWLSLYQRYFHFKQLVHTASGALQRKDRCPDIPLIDINPNEEAMTPTHITNKRILDRSLKMLVAALDRIQLEQFGNAKLWQSAEDVKAYLRASYYLDELPAQLIGKLPYSSTAVEFPKCSK